MLFAQAEAGEGEGDRRLVSPPSQDGSSSFLFRAPMAKRDSETTRLLSQGTDGTLERFRNVFDSRPNFRVLL